MTLCNNNISNILNDVFNSSMFDFVEFQINIKMDALKIIILKLVSLFDCFKNFSANNA